MLQTLNINCCKESLISEEGKIYQTNIYQTFQSILLTLWKAPLCGPMDIHTYNCRSKVITKYPTAIYLPVKMVVYYFPFGFRAQKTSIQVIAISFNLMRLSFSAAEIFLILKLLHSTEFQSQESRLSK